MPIMNTTSIPAAMVKGIDKVFNFWDAETESYYEKFMDVRTSDKYMEFNQAVVSFGLATSMQEGDFPKPQVENQWYRQTLAFEKFGIAATVTQDFLKYNLMKDKYSISAIGQRLYRAMDETVEIVGHQIVNNAFNSNIPVVNGQSLISTAHPQHTVGGGGTQSNWINESVSESGFRNLFSRKASILTPEGHRFMLKGQKIICNPILELDLKTLFNTERQVGTANNDINSIKAYMDMDVISTPYFASTTRILVQTDFGGQPEVVFRQKPSLSSEKLPGSLNSAIYYHVDLGVWVPETPWCFFGMGI